MWKYIFVLLVLSGCTTVPEVPRITNPSDVEIIGWKFDVNEFTDDMRCHQYFMNSDKEIDAYFEDAVSISEEKWNKNTRAAACMIKGEISTSVGRCTFLIWEYSIKGTLTCPAEKPYFLINVSKRIKR